MMTAEMMKVGPVMRKSTLKQLEYAKKYRKVYYNIHKDRIIKQSWLYILKHPDKHKQYLKNIFIKIN